MPEVRPSLEVYNARFLISVTIVRKIITAHRAMHTDTEPCTLLDCHAINQWA